jgi:hypothetical protein
VKRAKNVAFVHAWRASRTQRCAASASVLQRDERWVAIKGELARVSPQACSDRSCAFAQGMQYVGVRGWTNGHPTKMAAANMQRLGVMHA